MGFLILIVWLAVIVLLVVSMWKVFVKAGRPGWEAIIPIYNMYILATQIAKLEILWFILTLIPIANIVAAIKISLVVAEKFGKSQGFGIGLALLPFVFYPMLAFSDATFQGGAAATAPPPPPGQQPPAQPPQA